jgi:hypothetical protein
MRKGIAQISSPISTWRLTDTRSSRQGTNPSCSRVNNGVAAVSNETKFREVSAWVELKRLHVENDLVEALIELHRLAQLFRVRVDETIPVWILKS